MTGNVSDSEGPVIGASVVEKGNPSNGAVTDLDGNFSINVKPGATIIITYIGYKTKEIVVGGQQTTRPLMRSLLWVMVFRKRNSSLVLPYR